MGSIPRTATSRVKSVCIQEDQEEVDGPLLLGQHRRGNYCITTASGELAVQYFVCQAMEALIIPRR